MKAMSDAVTVNPLPTGACTADDEVMARLADTAIIAVTVTALVAPRRKAPSPQRLFLN
jgi:hypothetical protein